MSRCLLYFAFLLNENQCSVPISEIIWRFRIQEQEMGKVKRREIFLEKFRIRRFSHVAEEGRVLSTAEIAHALQLVAWRYSLFYTSIHVLLLNLWNKLHLCFVGNRSTRETSFSTYGMRLGIVIGRHHPHLYTAEENCPRIELTK